MLSPHVGWGNKKKRAAPAVRLAGVHTNVLKTWFKLHYVPVCVYICKFTSQLKCKRTLNHSAPPSPRAQPGWRPTLSCNCHVLYDCLFPNSRGMVGKRVRSALFCNHVNLIVFSKIPKKSKLDQTKIIISVESYMYSSPPQAENLEIFVLFSLRKCNFPKGNRHLDVSDLQNFPPAAGPSFFGVLKKIKKSCFSQKCWVFPPLFFTFLEQGGGNSTFLRKPEISVFESYM